MGHIILLGDSIFDNARYVPGCPAVIDQVRSALPSGWRASLLAVDGHTTHDLDSQLRGLPADATHLVVSAGGNDALGESGILTESACTVDQALRLIQEVRARFRIAYHSMLEVLATVRKPTAVCTIYDAIPGLGAAERAALASFNEIILREAFSSGLPVIDLRLVCDQQQDFSNLSPIEPSMAGGAKIARTVSDVATKHDFGDCRSVIYI